VCHSSRGPHLLLPPDNPAWSVDTIGFLPTTDQNYSPDWHHFHCTLVCDLNRDLPYDSIIGTPAHETVNKPGFAIDLHSQPSCQPYSQ